MDFIDYDIMSEFMRKEGEEAREGLAERKGDSVCLCPLLHPFHKHSQEALKWYLNENEPSHNPLHYSHRLHSSAELSLFLWFNS